MFHKSVEVIAPGTTTVRAFHLTKGKLDTTLVGLPQISVTAPPFSV